MELAQVSRGFRRSELFRELLRITEGEAPLPESDAKRHHFVPKLLLKRFSPRPNRIWQLEKKTRGTLDVRIDKAASRRRLYEFLHNDIGQRTARMEAWLALVESHSSAALTRLEHPGPLLGLADWDRATVAFFLVLLSIRTPQALGRAEEMGAETLQIFFGSQLSDAETFANFHSDRFPDTDSEESDDLRLRALDQLEKGEIGFEDPAGAAMRGLVSASGEVSQRIFASRWIMLRAARGQFVTSDVGLAMHDPEPKFPWSAQAWQSSPSVEVTIPLSSTACLLITPGPATFDRIDVDEEEVEEVNLRTFGWADRFLFGAERTELERLTRQAARKPELVVEPKPRRSVCLLQPADGDRSLADEHRRRGWPEYVSAPDPQTGERCPHDYMVVGEDGEALEVVAKATQRAKQRFRRETADAQKG
jgi:hypothetical protein